jgi:outer membrane lipoprotein-sorting protein
LQKIGYILFIVIFIAGCSVFNHSADSRIEDIGIGNRKPVIEYAKDKNLSSNSFYIKNMAISIFSGKDENKLNGSLRFESPDKFLISMRSKSGIEVSRIFINKDSVYIVDRIKRKVYCSSVKYIEDKYGIPFVMLPVLLGDLKGNCGMDYSNINKKGTMLSKCSVGDVNISYVIDNVNGKVNSLSAMNRFGTIFFTAVFDRFKRDNLAFYPSKISWTDIERSINVEITIQKIEYPWIDKIEFSIGSRYEVIELL